MQLTPRKTSTQTSLWLALLIVCLCVIPFLNKPFSFDDAFYIWKAQYIQSHFFDPYGYQLNWYGLTQPAYKIAFAPPGFCYVLALWGYIFGLSEVSCHILNLSLTLITVLGIFSIAEELDCDPFTSALITIVSPLFVMSATSVMCEMLLLALWVWALVLWLRALRQHSWVLFGASSLLASLCVLTKYNGAFIVVLMALASWLSKRKLDKNWGWLLIPPLSLVAYFFWFHAMYQTDLITNTAKFVSNKHGFHLAMTFNTVATGVVFMGAITIALFPFAWVALRLRQIGWIAAITIAIEAVYVLIQRPTSLSWLLQHICWMFSGIALTWLVIYQAVRYKDRTGWLLLVWFMWSIIFPIFLNWGISARSFITVAPILGLAASRLLPEKLIHSQVRMLFFATPMALCAVSVAMADFEFARIQKSAAHELVAQFRNAGLSTHQLWFGGHWGFQYYMQTLGAKPIDLLHSQIEAHDVLVFPANGQGSISLKNNNVQVFNTLSVPSAWPVAIMNKEAGAGYHSYYWGALPFTFGAKVNEDFYLAVFLRAETGMQEGLPMTHP